MEQADKTDRKAALKALRATRKDSIARASSTMKAQKKDIEAITRFLSQGEATVPDVAQGVGMPADKTLWYMATLKKYGRIVEGAKAGAFFNYRLNPARSKDTDNDNKEKTEGAK